MIRAIRSRIAQGLTRLARRVNPPLADDVRDEVAKNAIAQVDARRDLVVALLGERASAIRSTAEVIVFADGMTAKLAAELTVAAARDAGVPGFAAATTIH